MQLLVEDILFEADEAQVARSALLSSLQHDQAAPVPVGGTWASVSAWLRGKTCAGALDVSTALEVMQVRFG